MKTSRMLYSGICLLAAVIFTACEKDDDLLKKSVVSSEDQVLVRANQNSVVFPPNSHPYGNSMEEWTAAFWTHVWQSTLETFPILDETGAYTDLNQSGPVYYLFGSFGATVERTATIPQGKAVLFPILNYFNDYPCPWEGFEPAPGQTLEEFLQEGAADFVDRGENLSVTLDGADLNNISSYRFTTDLFYITGDPELSAIDPCLTGESQAAASDGYWMMLKPLSVGEHTLHFHAEVPDYGFIVDVTYNITVV